MKIKIYLALVCVFLFGWTIIFAQVQEPQVQEPQVQEPQVQEPQVQDINDEVQFPNSGSTILSKKERESSYNKWYNPDYRPTEIFNYLLHFSDDYSRFKIRLATSNYQTARSIMFKANRKIDEIKKESSTKKHLGERWYWQTLDRIAEEERIISNMKLDAKEDAVIYLTKSIHHMDKITKESIRKTDAFLDLMSDVFRLWSVYQYDLGNHLQCIDILNRYIALREENDREVEVHTYLASAYEHQERILRKSRLATLSTKEYFKKKKNEHMLMAVELSHGRDTVEYAKILEVVHMDEVISVVP